MSFQLAVEKVLKHEGGFVDHPADRGGATNWGITQKVYEKFKGRAVTLAEMKNMPKSDAIAIYKAEYWDKVGGGQLKFYSIAFVIFDQAINRGVGSAVMQAQRIAGVKADGAMGPKTIAAINTMGETDFMSKYLAASLNFYESVVKNRPSQSAFIDGWRNRITSIEDYVGQFVGKENGAVALSAGTILMLVGFVFLFVSLAKVRA